MDTTKILHFRHPSQAEMLLEALVRERLQTGSHSRRVTERSELPSAVQRLVISAARDGKVWSAWGERSALRCYISEMIPARLAGEKCTALRVTAYDSRGRLAWQRIYALLNDGSWQAAAIRTSRGPDPVPWPAQD